MLNILGCIFLHLRLSPALDVTDFSIAVVLSRTSCLIKIRHLVIGASELGLDKMLPLQNDIGVQFMLLRDSSLGIPGTSGDILRIGISNSWRLHNVLGKSSVFGARPLESIKCLEQCPVLAFKIITNLVCP